MKQDNIYKFEYEQKQLSNKDGSDSRFSVVYGEGGNVIHTKKDSYHIIPTADVSILANVIKDKGYEMTPYIHRKGEVIGLSVNMGKKISKVGDSSYNLYITIPNNGGGKGYLALKQVRLICSNGMVVTESMHKDGYIRIPHTIDYKSAIEMMGKAVVTFRRFLDDAVNLEKALDGVAIDQYEARKMLNEWYYNYEMPSTHKKDMTSAQFREMLAVNPEEIKGIDRYNKLMVAFNSELENNKELNLELSHYTIFATATNYLSRKVEASRSKAPTEIQDLRQEKKLQMFNAVLN